MEKFLVKKMRLERLNQQCVNFTRLQKNVTHEKLVLFTISWGLVKRM